MLLNYMFYLSRRDPIKNKCNATCSFRILTCIYCKLFYDQLFTHYIDVNCYVSGNLASTSYSSGSSSSSFTSTLSMRSASNVSSSICVCTLSSEHFYSYFTNMPLFFYQICDFHRILVVFNGFVTFVAFARIYFLFVGTTISTALVGGNMSHGIPSFTIRLIHFQSEAATALFANN